RSGRWSLRANKKGGPLPGRPCGVTDYGLPVELEPHLDLARQDVLSGNRSGNDAAEVRVLDAVADVVTTVIVVVQQVERFEAELAAHPLVDAGALEERGVHLQGVMDADLARAVGEHAIVREARGFEPSVVAPVVAEVRAAAEADG